MKRRTCRIALVARDETADLLATMLRQAGHACLRMPADDPLRLDGASLFDRDVNRFDLLLIEQGSAATLIADVRARHGFALPIIALAPAEDTDGRVAALDDGADECLALPVPPRLLLAQMHALLRRIVSAGDRVEAAVGHLRFRPEGNRVSVDGADVMLTAKEYALGLALCRNLGSPLAREDLLGSIWGGDVAPLTRTLDVHVSRLRSKLELCPQRGFRLTALYGRGYRLDYRELPEPVTHAGLSAASHLGMA